MFYEEAVIDSVLQFRTTPTGEWRKVGIESLTAMLMASRATVKALVASTAEGGVVKNG